jgi:hypothetical protein
MEELYPSDITELLRKEKGDVERTEPYIDEKGNNGMRIVFTSGNQLIVTSGEGINGVQVKMLKYETKVAVFK